MITADHNTGVSGPCDFKELCMDMLELFSKSMKYDDWNAAMVLAMSALGGNVERTYREHLMNDQPPVRGAA